ncbi:MAG: DUF4834 domain-containing protein [Urechidicola sp.]|nr:DUF4834 domain-containing protein [Urechidicola sp.]
MHEASVQGFVRTILIFIIIYYAVKIIGRFVAPLIFKWFVGKFEQRVKDQQQQNSPRNDEKVGETTIDKTSIKSTKESNSVGEYVDFEEVDE